MEYSVLKHHAALRITTHLDLLELLRLTRTIKTLSASDAVEIEKLATRLLELTKTD